MEELQHLQIAQRRPIDEENLNAIFIRNISQQWSSYTTTYPTVASLTTFLSPLPLLLIKLCASLSKIAPLLSKGQRRLEDLKAGAIKAQKAPLKPTTTNSISNPR